MKAQAKTLLLQYNSSTKGNQLKDEMSHKMTIKNKTNWRLSNTSKNAAAIPEKSAAVILLFFLSYFSRLYIGIASSLDSTIRAKGGTGNGEKHKV